MSRIVIAFMTAVLLPLSITGTGHAQQPDRPPFATTKVDGTDNSAEIKKMAQDGKCWNPAEKEFKLPGYETWPGYKENLEFIARRYCGLWGRGT